MEMEKKKTLAVQLPKIAVTGEADGVLSAALEKVNDGFLGGKVTKLDLASWALLDSLTEPTDATVERIRKRFFNEVCYLEAVLKQTRARGQDKLAPEQIAQLQSVLNTKGEKSRKPKGDPEPPLSLE